MMELEPQPPKQLQEQKHKQERGQRPTQKQSTATLPPTERKTGTTPSTYEMKKQANQKQKQKPKEHQKPKQIHKPSLSEHAAPLPTQHNTTTQTTMAAPVSDSAFKVTQPTISQISQLYTCACKGEARKYCLWTHVEVEDQRIEVEIDFGGGGTAKTWEKDRWKWDEEFDPKNQGKRGWKKEVKRVGKK